MIAGPGAVFRIRLLSVVFTVVLLAVGLAYGLAERAQLLAQADRDTGPLLAEKVRAYEGLVRAVRGWSEIVQSRWYLVSSAGRTPALRASLPALLVDLTRTGDGLAQVVIVNVDGWMLYSSDGAPGPVAHSIRHALPPEVLTRAMPFAAGHAPGRSGVTAGREMFFFWSGLRDADGSPAGAVGFAIDPATIANLLALQGRQHRSFHLASSATGTWSGPGPIRLSGAGWSAQAHWQDPALARPLTLSAYRMGDLAGLDTLVGVTDLTDLLRHDWWPQVVPAAVVLMALATVLLTGGWLMAGGVGRLQRRTREALVARRWSEGVFNAASDAMVVVNHGQRIVYINPAAETILGYRPERLVDMPLSALVPAALHRAHEALVADTFAQGRSIARMGEFRTVRCIRADGTDFPVSVSIGHVAADGEAFAVAIIRDMTGIERANQRLSELAAELSVQLEAAQRASKAKTDFLAQMSHELRTPLNAVIGFNEIMEKDMFGKGLPDIYREYAHDARVSGQHLLGILNDILDLARIEADRIDLDPGDIAVADIWDLPVRNFRSVGSTHAVAVGYEPAPDGLQVHADLRAARQCVFNIVHNAIKFTRPGGQVTCRTEVGPDHVDLVVADTGRGMDSRDIPRLLQPFEQHGEAMVAERQGTGLGLTITNRLMAAMGGRLLIASNPGQGTTVRLRFPRAGAATIPTENPS